MAKYCTNCGAELKNEADICLKCGKIVNENIKKSNINVDPNAKSKLAAGLFGIFLGCFGVHNFYLGYTGKAVAQLLITVLSCFFLSPISAIWGLIEGILILAGSIDTDAEGHKLTD
ncbi:MAG: TM2 domain-containing protein [Bacilli bacterium]|nr:TM2 domain-containing protein [Bacilli bacterium]